ELLRRQGPVLRGQRILPVEVGLRPGALLLGLGGVGLGRQRLVELRHGLRERRALGDPLLAQRQVGRRQRIGESGVRRILLGYLLTGLQRLRPLARRDRALAGREQVGGARRGHGRRRDLRG